MASTITMLDCDFGGGEIDREFLEPLAYRVVLGQAASVSDVIKIAVGSSGLTTQYAPVTRTVLESSAEVRAVVRYGVGLDCIDTVAARELGVSISGVNEYCTDEVADHAMALLLTAIRSIHVSDSRSRRGVGPYRATCP